MSDLPTSTSDPMDVASVPRNQTSLRMKARLFRRRLSVIGRESLWNLWVNQIASWHVVPPTLRKHLLKPAGIDVGSVGMYGGYYITNSDLTIGRDTFINAGLFADARGGIHIGDRVALGPRVLLCSSTHRIGPQRMRSGEHLMKPIYIGDGAAVGADSAIHAGVTIGAGAVVAAGSIVWNDCEPNAVYAGSPARLVKRFDE